MKSNHISNFAKVGMMMVLSQEGVQAINAETLTQVDAQLRQQLEAITASAASVGAGVESEVKNYIESQLQTLESKKKKSHKHKDKKHKHKHHKKDKSLIQTKQESEAPPNSKDPNKREDSLIAPQPLVNNWVQIKNDPKVNQTANVAA